MAKVPNINPTLLTKLKQRATSSHVTYRIAAFAFSKKGNLLGSAVSAISRHGKDTTTKHGSGRHAEREVIAKYGRKIHTIVIMRIGHGGDIRPIHPCKKCKEVADKYGIKILSVESVEDE